MTLRLKLLVLVAGVTLFATTGITALSLWRGLLQSQEHLSCEGAAIAASAASAASAWLAPGGPVPGAEKALVPVLERALASAPRLAARAAWLAGAFIGAGLLFATLLLRHITRPLSDVVRAADRLSAGERITVHVRSDPELNDLVAAFNRMSQRLRESRAEMETL